MPRRNIIFSVIIPTWNRSYVLERAVNSVLNQNFPCSEVIIVDDGSTDETEVCVERIQREVLEGKSSLKKSNYQTIPDIKYFKISRSGVSFARNRGVDIAKEDWVAFLDSDDEWLPNKLLRQREQIKENPQISIFHGEEIWIRRGVRVNPHKKHKKQGGRVFKACIPLCCISPSTVVLRKELFLRAGGFDESYPVCEDYDLWLRLCEKEKVYFDSVPLLRKYGGHPDQLSHTYVAMDFWRVKSLYRHVHSAHITGSERNYLMQVLIKKTEILIKGYKKFNNLENLPLIEKIYSEICHSGGAKT